MNFVQKQDLFFHVNQFFVKLTNGEPIVSKDILQKSFSFHIQYLFLIVLLGVTIIGIPLIWLFVFLKGLVIGCSVGFIVSQLGFKGLVLATVSIAPQNMLIIRRCSAAASLANVLSTLLLRRITARPITTPIGRPLIQYVPAFSLLFIAAFFGSLIETFISYEAVKFAIESLS